VAWIAVIGVSILLVRVYIYRSVDSGPTRRTIVAWLTHSDPIRPYPRDSTVVIDSLRAAEILDEGGDTGPMRVLADVTYHAEGPDGRRGPFHRALTFVRRHGRWQVEPYQRININDIPLFQRGQEAPAKTGPTN